MEPPKPDYSKQRQTDPPTFGAAQCVSADVLAREVRKRRTRCEKRLRMSPAEGGYEPGRVSIVILSCKRWPMLERLIGTLKPFLESVETYQPVETILVDNGSGEALLDSARASGAFDEIIAFETNHGLTGALRRVFPNVRGEYILFVEDDFILEAAAPFLGRCVRLFHEYPEIGIIRLKNQNNWGKPFRRIGPLRRTSDGTAFWTWLPDIRRFPFRGGAYNVWAAGSVLFRKASYLTTGPLPDPQGRNLSRSHRRHQGYLYEYAYARRYNRLWLAAKIQNLYPFFQPNDGEICPGWGDATA